MAEDRRFELLGAAPNTLWSPQAGDRGLVGADGWLTADGRAVKVRIEALTDDLAAPAYDALQANELATLIADLEPIAAALNAAYDAEN